MCTDRGLDKEDVVHRHSGISPECALTEDWIKKMWCIDTVGYHAATEKNAAVLGAAARMDPEMIILSEVRERQISYDIMPLWNPKYDTDELIYEVETGLQTQRTDLWLPRE